MVSKIREERRKRLRENDYLYNSKENTTEETNDTEPTDINSSTGA